MTKQETANANARVLYLSYDGLTDPLGQSQVLPYLAGLSKVGHRITVVSCEKPDAMRREGAAIRTLCESAGIEWRPLRYHKTPPVLSSAYDMRMLERVAGRLHRERAFDLVHCRSYIPAATGLRLKRRFGLLLLFDMRGFWAEEKTEGKSWDLGNPLFRWVYRYFKRLESRLLADSDAIVSLTEAGKAELLKRPEIRGDRDRIEVIPCCVDTGLFRASNSAARLAVRRDLGIDGDVHVLAYLGSLGGNYMLGEMLDFFRVYRDRHPGARFLFVTREEPGSIRRAAVQRGVEAAELVIRAGSREEVPHLLGAADLGIAFKQASFSALGCSPTKVGEMLALGLPIVANTGVGDVDDIIDRTGCGVAITEFSDAAYSRALDALANCATYAAGRCRIASECFGVELGIERYDRIYQRLLNAIGNRRPPR